MTTCTIPPNDTRSKLRADMARLLDRLRADTSPLALLAATVTTAAMAMLGEGGEFL